MKKIGLIFYAALVLISCKEKTEAVTQSNDKELKESTPKQMENSNLPYGSKQASAFYKQDAISSDYKVVPGSNSAKSYDDKTIPVKEDDFGYLIAKGGTYYELENFKFPQATCKLMIYNVSGENDSNVLNIQLNSYDETNTLKDALLLDSRFTFETEYYRDFNIDKDGVIDIKKISVHNLTYNEQGDIVGERSTDSIASESVKYRIENGGKFVKSE